MAAIAMNWLRARGGAMRRLICPAVFGVVVVLGCCAHWFAQVAVAQEGSWVAEGEHVTIDLVLMPEKYQDSTWRVIDLFDASPDSSFWFGPVRPNIHSWLGPSVIIRETTGFEIEFCSEDGEEIEALAFSGVQPAFYRVSFRKEDFPEPGLYTLRFKHAGVVVHEGKYDWSSQNR